ncbi:fused MFS/spermidine synthase [Aurantiacibacter sp. D1-12]|uniref:fused MFS/spermidine synthase n=1 Tax=Aurantiacibacter sp. D1-12 TaxID=2993658 RepID=UPI00237CE0F3|nr:fused MFS/spermidine synthase [Aurantiacibacter sp. D1-12]MDE1468154.1 fused MFS/spermidine synthase [Aurantiacibacter sp. D1-12]
MASSRRWLFTITILAGSFLLFLVQPMVARMALPRLGGAPNVWNSAMLVYQALLLGGYAYAHFIGRFSLRTQGIVHVIVLALGGLTLPLALADIAPPAPGLEAFWVPWLFLLTVGPAFFAISAQAPLIQRWFAAHPEAGNPYPLYAASNLGSFGGLLTYPLLAEPLFSIGQQSLYWAIGYALLIVLVITAVMARSGVEAPVAAETAASEGEGDASTSWKTIGLWLALAAIPSGLMLSTTTFLTTDIMAMPLLWVIPLGLYLLSFSIAFAEKRAIAGVFVFIAPVILLVDGSIAMFAAGRADLLAAAASIILLFVVAVALHSKLYEHRPPPSQLTKFYLIMSAGGALGGLFTALIAPVVFDWTWEHPLLILGAAALLPLGAWRKLLGNRFSNPRIMLILLAVTVIIVFNASLAIFQSSLSQSQLTAGQWAALIGVLLIAMLLAARRWSYVLGCAAMLLSLGGLSNLQTSAEGMRERSYFGIYSLREEPDGDTLLMHGTTIHGVQRAGEEARRMPTAYYGRNSGVGRSLMMAETMFGANARVGVVGLGVGTLACYKQPGQDWTFFEIDPVVLDYSDNGQFTYLSDCAPDSPIVIGDARLELEEMQADSFDVLVIDAFSSDAIPLHLLTAEALDIYLRAIPDDGLLVMHISNNYIRLQPVIARLAESRGLTARLRSDGERQEDELFASSWVALSRDPARVEALASEGGWDELEDPEGPVWTDDYASILPYLVWENFL